MTFVTSIMNPTNTSWNLTVIEPIPYFLSPANTSTRAVFLLPQQTIRWQNTYTKRFLVHDLMPPDASRGFDVPPAVFTVAATDALPVNCEYVTSTWTITMPYPDASMPYNVITLVKNQIQRDNC